ncbi:hypothetical protein T459_23275 [Capsicum annuum]|uniref:Uncharacterized protein n=1 Tax=Capsicum annuum TaxID=4072 RepID=A0A2G2YRW8_CAPAN|nr:hypothetical protein FXO37_14654 [Capsicum annuum]PHT72490.1 hypothetical protein T459_23275 [Capsicum annuum]
MSVQILVRKHILLSVKNAPGNTSPLDYLSEFELISLMEKHDSLELEHGACGNLDYIIVPCCGELRQSKSGHYHKPLDVPGIGELALGPLIFGASSTLLNADQNEIYLKEMPILNGKFLRRHGDVFECTSKGYYHAYGRADDTINLGGIKVSSLEIESICTAVDENIQETTVVGAPPIGGGPGKLVITAAVKDSDKLEQNLVNLMMSFNMALQRKNSL